MSDRYTNLPPGTITLERDIFSGYNWPGTDKLAVCRLTVDPGRWIAADRVTASDGTSYESAQEAAAAIDARLPGTKT